jgi:hypothetical protein
MDFLSLLDEQNGSPQARRSVQNFGGNDGKSLAPEILHRSRNGCRTETAETAGNQHARSLSERHSRPSHRNRRSGGARRDRTDDLLLAKQALSQLSYGPFGDQQSGISNQKQPQARAI